MCSICTIVLTGEMSWRQHLAGTPHKKRAQRAAAIGGASNSNAPSLRWTCPTCLVCNDSASGLFAHVGGASHRRAVSVLTDDGRSGELRVILPRLCAAAQEVRRAGGDYARCTELVRETEARAGPGAAGGPAGTSGSGSSSGHGQPSDAVDAGAAEVGSHVRKRRREDDTDCVAGARATVCSNEFSRDGNDVQRRDRGEVAACTSSRGVSSSPPPLGGHGDTTHAVARAAATCSVPASLQSRHAVVVPLGARVLFECRVCHLQHPTAEDFFAHVCNVHIRKGKRPAQ